MKFRNHVETHDKFSLAIQITFADSQESVIILSLPKCRTMDVGGKETDRSEDARIKSCLPTNVHRYIIV